MNGQGIADLVYEYSTKTSGSPAAEELLASLGSSVEDEYAFAEFVDNRVEMIEQFAANKPDAALEVLTQTTMALSQLSQRQPKYVKRLSTWISKLRSPLESLKTSTGASSFSLTLALGPVSIGMTW